MSGLSGEPAADAVTFDVVVTLSDHLAIDRFGTKTAAYRRKLAVLAICGLVIAPAVAFAVALIARAALAGSDCDLDETMDSNGRLRFFLVATACVAVMEAVGAAAVLALRSRSVRANRVAVLSKRPGIDPADAELREPHRFTFDANRFRIESPGIVYGMVWTIVPRVEETVDHIFVFIAPLNAVIVPKRDVPPAKILAVRDLARASGKLAAF